MRLAAAWSFDLRKTMPIAKVAAGEVTATLTMLPSSICRGIGRAVRGRAKRSGERSSEKQCERGETNGRVEKRSGGRGAGEGEEDAGRAPHQGAIPT